MSKRKKSKTPTTDKFLDLMFPDGGRSVYNAMMRVTDVRLFNEDGSPKNAAERLADIERRKREYPR